MPDACIINEMLSAKSYIKCAIPLLNGTYHLPLNYFLACHLFGMVSPGTFGRTFVYLI